MTDKKEEKTEQDVAGFPNTPDYDEDAESTPPEKTEGS